MGLWCERLVRLERPRAPWGDVGTVVIHGLVSERDDETAPLLLRRTGPFVPPISQPQGAVIVDETARRRLLESDLTGFAFGPVRIHRVTSVPWTEWDRRQPRPPMAPPGGEPEGYVDELVHRPDLLPLMGTLYELQAARSVDVDETSGLRVLESSWDGADFAGALGTRWLLVSARARAWLEAHFSEWVSFAAVPSCG